MASSCSHIKYGVVYTSYELTRTICEGEDPEGRVKVEICDLCKTFIITIKTLHGTQMLQLGDGRYED